MSAVLLLVDIQNDYFQGGAMELNFSEEAGKRASQLLQAFRERALPVVHVRHVSNRPGATFFLPGTKGAEIHELSALFRVNRFSSSIFRTVSGNAAERVPSRAGP